MLVWRAILSVLVGIVAVVWPGITVGAFVILFAVNAFFAAVMRASEAFRSRGGGYFTGRLLLAVLDAAAGIVALVWPGITALSIVIVISAWALVAGIIEVTFAVRAGQTAGERALLELDGLVSVALGIVFSVRPDVGAVTIAQVYGLFSIIAGVSGLVLHANLKDMGERRNLHLSQP